MGRHIPGSASHCSTRSTEIQHQHDSFTLLIVNLVVYCSFAFLCLLAYKFRICVAFVLRALFAYRNKIIVKAIIMFT